MNKQLEQEHTRLLSCLLKLTLLEYSLEMDSLSSNEYDNLVAKGRSLYNRLLAAVSRNTTQVESLPEIAPHYHLEMDPSDGIFASDPTTRAITEAGHPTRDYVLILAGNPGNRQWAYQNYVHKTGKAILCMNNYANRDLLLGRPEQIFWSDMMAVCHAQVVSDNGGKAENLEAIWRVFIKNTVFKTRTSCSLLKTDEVS